MLTHPHNETTRPRGRLRNAIRLRQLAGDAAAGAITGLLTLALSLSLVALIFVGPLAAYIAYGVGLVLISTAVMNFAQALFSARRPLIITTQDAPAVVVAMLVATIAGAGLHSGANRYATVVAAIAVTTLATAAVFFVLGRLRLGSLVRYLPYPVVGGFLAGTGWLLLLGGIGMMAGSAPSPATLAVLLTPAMLGRWLPGLIFAVLLLLVLRRFKHGLIMPGMLVGAGLLFYGWLALSGHTLAGAQERGLLLGPFPDEVVWAPLTPALLALVDWRAIAGSLDLIGTAVTISVVSLLLNVSALQLAEREPLDLNQELRTAGMAQALGGLLGGAPGYPALSLTLLGRRMGAQSRLTTAFVGLLFIGVFALGGDLLALAPRVALGGVICYLGLSFLAEWLYDAWFQLPALDYGLVVGILTMIIAFGILPGVVVGLGIAVVRFVVTYSRIDVVKHALTGSVLRSRVSRSDAEQRWLTANGAQIAVFQLHGFIFFGTAHDLCERICRRAMEADAAKLRFVVIDFRLVTGLDSTALMSFQNMLQLAVSKDLTLLFSQLPGPIERQVLRALPQAERADRLHITPNLDAGLEWCEKELLATTEYTAPGAPPFDQSDPELPILLAALKRRTVAAGEVLIRQGDDPAALFFIAAGQFTAQTTDANGTPVRLEQIGAGGIIGELGFFLGIPRTAAVIADESGSVYELTRADLQRLEQAHPAAATVFHRLSSKRLSERVVHLMRVVEALQR
jgi:SulP family sulfate permease